MASATPDLWLPFQPKLVLIAPTHGWMATPSWPRWLVTNIPEGGHHSGTNRAQRRVTTLIKTDALSLR